MTIGFINNTKIAFRNFKITNILSLLIPSTTFIKLNLEKKHPLPVSAHESWASQKLNSHIKTEILNLGLSVQKHL